MKHILLGFNHNTLALTITELMGLQWVMYNGTQTTKLCRIDGEK